MHIPDAYRYYVDNLVKQARLIVEKGEPLAALAFVGHLESRKVNTIRLDDSSEASKDRSARLVQIQAELMHADFIVMVREAWQLPEKHVQRYDEIIDSYGSIGASPFAQDIVALSVETVHGHWMATPLLRPKPPSKKRRTFGEVSWAFMPGMSGRFVGLLPMPSTQH